MKALDSAQIVDHHIWGVSVGGVKAVKPGGSGRAEPGVARWALVSTHAHAVGQPMPRPPAILCLTRFDGGSRTVNMDSRAPTFEIRPNEGLGGMLPPATGFQGR